MKTTTTTKSRRINPRTTTLAALAAALLLGASVTGCAMDVVDSDEELAEDMTAEEAAYEAEPELGIEPLEVRDPRSFGFRAWSEESAFDPTGPLHAQGSAGARSRLVVDTDGEAIDDGLAGDVLVDPSVTVTE